MIQLPLEYKKNGFVYKQLFRDGSYVIYEQYEEGQVIALEVSEIINQPATEIFGNKIEAREKVPSSEQWGSKAFTVRTFDQAIERIEKMKASKKQLNKAS